MSTLPPPVPPPPPSPTGFPGLPPRSQGAAPGMATAALVCGLVGVVMPFFGAPSIVAIVLGVIAWRRAKAAPGFGDNRGRALAGWILGIVGTAFFALFIVAAVASEDTDAGDGTSSTGGRGGTVSIEDLDVGDCIVLDVDATELFDADVVDCDEWHVGEVYFVVELPGGAEFPGRSTVERQASDRCGGDAFTDYVGAPMEATELSVLTIHPTSDSWRLGDREVTCVATNLDGTDLYGTVEGSG